MNKQERADFVKKVKKTLSKTEAPLNFSNPFTLLIAVPLSAQCTDERVNIVTKDLFKKAKTPKQMLSRGEKSIRNNQILWIGSKKSKQSFEPQNVNKKT